MAKQAFVYIMTNKSNRVLYTGVTSNLIRRVYQHKHSIFRGFTMKYNVKKLVYYEIFDNINDAIMAEKRIKKGPRQRKIELINRMNPEWNDLGEEL